MVLSVRHTTSKGLSFYERCRNLDNKELKYLCPQARYRSHSDEQQIDRRNEVFEAYQKLQFFIDGNRPDNAYGTATDVATVCRKFMESYISTCDVHRKQNMLSLSRHDMVFQVLHEFMGILPSWVTSDENVRSIGGTILNPLGLMRLLQDEGLNGVAGHQQWLYPYTITKVLPSACNQLISVIWKFVNQRCHTDFNDDDLIVDSNEVSRDKLIEREATIKIQIQSMRRRLISVTWTWIRDYIATEMGTVYNCYIAE